MSKLAVGRRVVVVGGGMTAIDAAVQSKLLGAEDVTIVYRRGQSQMKASRYEQDLAQSKGVRIKHWARPVEITGSSGKVTGVTCEYTRESNGKLAGTGETFRIDADMVMKAIGQSYVDGPLGGQLELSGGRLKVDGERRTSHPKMWAGGDCVAGGEDLTVAAVADGREAAQSISRVLAG